MTAPPNDLERALNLAFERAKTMAAQMLAANEVGYVRVDILSPYEFKPVKVVESEGKTVRVRVGYGEVEKAR